MWHITTYSCRVNRKPVMMERRIIVVAIIIIIIMATKLYMSIRVFDGRGRLHM